MPVKTVESLCFDILSARERIYILQRGPLVSAPDLNSVGRGFKSRSDH